MGRIPKTLLAVAAVLVAACASQPKVERAVATREGTVQVIDDIYHLSRATPDWIFLEPAEMEKTSDDEGRYVFKSVSAGSDLYGRQLWVKDFTMSSDLAKFVGVRVQDAFVGAAAGDVDMLETYRESVVKTVSGAQYSGARIVKRYWWQIRTARADGGIEDVYEYYLLYTVDKPQIDAAIKRALDENDLKDKAMTEEEQAARDRVKRIMESEGL
jgi:hypothetical protein